VQLTFSPNQIIDPSSHLREEGCNMSSTNKPKRNHHSLPRLYLKGFVEIEGSPYIWEYQKGIPFNLTNKKLKINPFHKPISKAASTRDLYALKKGNEIVDFDTYENKLEDLEEPSTPLFKKMRSYHRHDMLTKEEKLTFSRYVLLMLKRIPAQQKKMSELVWPQIEGQMEYRLTKSLDDYGAQADFSDPAKLGAYEKKKSEIFEIFDQLRKGIPDEVRLKAMVTVEDPGFATILSQMTWQFWIAQANDEFFTGDNPVFYFTEFGINKNISELSFPISKKVCLVASWQNVEEGYFPVDTSMVQIINSRTAQRAYRYLYATSCSKAIYNYTLSSSENANQIKLLYPPLHSVQKHSITSIEPEQIRYHLHPNFPKASLSIQLTL